MTMRRQAKIGILCWESGVAPKGLQQLEALKGNSTNPDSYAYAVEFRRIPGANIHTVLEHPSRQVLAAMIKAARCLVDRGILALTTSCGFNIIFQPELAAAVEIPVFTSSLLQVPFAARLLTPRGRVGIITASKVALTAKHLTRAGITPDMPVVIAGLETCDEWNRIFTDPEAPMNIKLVREYILKLCRRLTRDHGVEAFVLECTDLPPFSAAIRRTTGKPVFDFMTMTNYMASVIGG